MSSTNVKKRGSMLVIGILVIVISYSIIYQQLLINIAGVDTSIISSVQVVVESLTTAGFGGDTEIWDGHDIITGFIILMNLTGMAIVFLAIPIFIVPLIQPALKPQPNENTDLEDHVVLCGFSGNEEVLIQELEDSGIPYLIVSESSEETIQLEEDGFNCLFGSLNDTDTFESANVDESRAVVIKSLGERSVSSIITVRECSDNVKIITVPETTDRESYHKYAGSDVTIHPRSVLASSISSKITSSVARNVDSELFESKEFDFKELLVGDDSQLSGLTISEANLRENIGTSVVGIWKNGILIPSPPPDTVISSGSILLINGNYNTDYLGVKELSSLSKQQPKFSKIAIIGFGVVGSSINSDLKEGSYEMLVVDKKVESADIIDDITKEDVINEVAKEDFDAIILALNDDQKTIYTTVGFSSKVSDTFILARCNNVQNVGKIYSSGADYVLSLSRVTQRIISSSIIKGEKMRLSTEYDINIVEDHDFDGVTLAEKNIRETYGYTVIAVKRGCDILQDIEPDFTIREDDKLVVVEDN